MQKFIRPKKRLAQHFLTDRNIAARIVEEAGIGPVDCVIEIGSGRGILTEELVKRAGDVTAVEIDRGLVSYLKERFPHQENLRIVCQDFLKFDLKEEYSRCRRPFKVIGNLPYYITTPILFYLLERRSYLETVTLMMQKEVAERVVAKPGGKDYGVLSVAVQFYALPAIVLHVKRDAFYPRPKVDSSVVKLEVLKEPPVKVEDEDLFFRIVRASFNQRRKTILNALSASGIANLEKKEWADIIEGAGFIPRRRGETFSINEFASLTRKAFSVIKGGSKN